MKNILLASLLISIFLLTDISYSKELEKENLTQIQELSSEKGILVIKEFIEVGSEIKGTYDNNLFLDGLIINNNVKGLKAYTLENIGSSGAKKEFSSFIDYDELENLAKSLNYIKDKAIMWKGTSKNYIEVFFKTKDNFKVGFFQENKKQTFFCSVDKLPEKNVVFNNLNSLEEIKMQVEKAIQILKN